MLCVVDFLLALFASRKFSTMIVVDVPPTACRMRAKISLYMLVHAVPMACVPHLADAGIVGKG